ncbi:hypothetical protein F2Q68_00009922 [Brassica cretica]|uniref:Uncharacterized protein n=1 Tax=Brassica cretica TaxID=69181 RepID=A0A8S9L2P9_BRACR|nr:hypothetical protein F2Q68_00009922 [Brassica cretica]
MNHNTSEGKSEKNGCCFKDLRTSMTQWLAAQPLENTIYVKTVVAAAQLSDDPPKLFVGRLDNLISYPARKQGGISNPIAGEAPVLSFTRFSQTTATIPHKIRSTSRILIENDTGVLESTELVFES